MFDELKMECRVRAILTLVITSLKGVNYYMVRATAVKITQYDWSICRNA